MTIWFIECSIIYYNCHFNTVIPNVFKYHIFWKHISSERPTTVCRLGCVDNRPGLTFMVGRQIGNNVQVINCANWCINRGLMLTLQFFVETNVSWHQFSNMAINSLVAARPRTNQIPSQIARIMGSTWGPPGSCRPQVGPMLAPWTLLSGIL